MGDVVPDHPVSEVFEDVVQTHRVRGSVLSPLPDAWIALLRIHTRSQKTHGQHQENPIRLLKKVVSDPRLSHEQLSCATMERLSMT
jgi:hypothetical protein